MRFLLLKLLHDLKLNIFAVFQPTEVFNSFTYVSTIGIRLYYVELFHKFLVKRLNLSFGFGVVM